MDENGGGADFDITIGENFSVDHIEGIKNFRLTSTPPVNPFGQESYFKFVLNVIRCRMLG